MTPKEFGYNVFIIETLFKCKDKFHHVKIIDSDREIGLRRLAEELQSLEAVKIRNDLMVCTIKYELRDKRIIYDK